MAPTLARDSLNATRDLPPVRLSEIVLRPARFAELNDRKNISGIAVDPDAFVARYRSGVPQPELVRV